MSRTTLPALFVALGLASAWLLWRLGSRRALLPCPSELSWMVELQNPLARATRSAHVLAQLAPQPGDRVLDLGCGPSRLTIPLARAVGSDGEVIAVDLQPAMLAKVAAKASRHALTNIRLLAKNAEQLECGRLNAAVLVMALGEIPSPAPVLSALASALQPGGRLLIAESVFDPHFVRRRRLRALAKAAGFVEARCSGNLFGYSIVFTAPVRH